MALRCPAGCNWRARSDLSRCRLLQSAGRRWIVRRTHHHGDYRRTPAGFGCDYGPSLPGIRSEEHTSELQSLMRISYAVFCLKKKTTQIYIDETIIYIYTEM